MTQPSDVKALLRHQTAFTDAYLECLFWSETHGDDATPFDDDYSPSDLDPATAREMVIECISFLSEAADLIEQTQMTWEQAGHDFCLTRNGHGAGFWDRGLGDAGDKLSDLAKGYGTANLYLGDDHKVYCS